MTLAAALAGATETEAGCWIPRHKPSPKGYVRASVDGARGYLHRLVYAALIAEPPPGLHLDHLCRNRSCCNPWHLEPVTPLVNVRRGRGHGSEVECPQGHPYSPDNTYVHRGKRQCRTCRLARVAIQNAQRKAAA